MTTLARSVVLILLPASSVMAEEQAAALEEQHVEQAASGILDRSVATQVGGKESKRVEADVRPEDRS